MNFKKFAAGLTFLAALSANATYTINIQQVGANVVMTGSGSLNTTAMASVANVVSCVGGFVTSNAICVGVSPSGLSFNAGITALTGLSTGNVIGNSTTGHPVFVAGTNLYLPAGYVSGSALNSSTTFNAQTLAGLGLTSGTSKTLTLTSGDTFVINIGPQPVASVASVPTLGEYALMGLASLMAMFGIAALKRRKS